MKPTFFKVRFRGEEVLLVGTEDSREGVLITPEDYCTGGDGIGWVGEDGTISVFGVAQKYTPADLEVLGPTDDPTEGMTDEQVEGLIETLLHSISTTLRQMAGQTRTLARNAHLN